MRRGLRCTTTLLTAALLTAAQGAAAHAAVDPTLLIQAPDAYYLRMDAPGDGDLFTMALNLAYVENEEPLAEDVTLTIDATSLAGKATLHNVGGACDRKGLVVTCSYSSIDGLTSVQPFDIKAAAGAKAGDTGTLAYTATASNAPTVTAKTKVTVGSPKLLTHRHAPIDESPPGATVQLTPRVANTGNLPADGVGIALYGQSGLSFAARHSNCHYRPDNATAYCEFPQEVAPDTAYALAEAVDIHTATDLMYGYASYYWWPLSGQRPDGLDPKEFTTTGEGPALGLTPVAVDSGFDQSGGMLDITTTQHADYQAVTGTVEGKVGRTVSVTLGVKNAGPGRMDLTGRESHGTGTYVVTPPEGTTVVAIPFPGEEDDWACSRKDTTPVTYVCDIDETMDAGQVDSLVFRVRIDKAVQGAEGTIKVVPRADYPTRDEDPGNNTAAIPVVITGGASPSSTASPTATPTASSSASASASPGATGSGDDAVTGGTSGGGLAQTGAGATVPVVVGAVVLLALGGAAFVLARRGRRRG